MPSLSNIMIERQAAPTGPLDYTSNAPSILAINGFFVGLSLLVVGARMYVRGVMLKTVGADDYVMMSAMLCSVGVLICFVGETHHGIGMHEDTITLPGTEKLLHWTFFHSLIVMFGISLIKISIGCFLLRLVTGKAYKYFLKGMIVFLTLFTIACAGTLIFACIPVQAAWDLSLAPTAQCYSKQTFTHIGLFNSIINIATDITFAALPIPIVRNLQVSTRTRISLICVLSLGFFACACAIVKTILQARFYSTPDYSFHDSYFVWNSVELNIGIIAACLPALRPLFAVILDTTRSLKSRYTTGGSSSSSCSRRRGKVYMNDEMGIGMGAVPKGKDGRRKFGKYGFTATTTTTTVVGTSSTDVEEGEEDFVKTPRADAGSEEGILPLQTKDIGIVKTYDVSVS